MICGEGNISSSATRTKHFKAHLNGDNRPASSLTQNKGFGQCHANLSDLLHSNALFNRAIYKYGSDRKHHLEIFKLIEKQKRQNDSLNLLFTGSSVTAMGYFTKFTEFLINEKQVYNLTIFNQGRGASDVVYHLYCVEYETIQPDIIIADLRFLDWNHSNQNKEALIRKLLSLQRRDGGMPLLVAIHLGRQNDRCDSPLLLEAKFNDFAGHYGFSLIDACLITSHCFKNDRWSLYSNDAIHPTTALSRIFLSEILKEWWLSAPQIYMKNANDMITTTTNKVLLSNTSSTTTKLPNYLYPNNAIQLKTYCKTLNEDNNDKRLMPIRNHGFEMKTRTKIGEMGFTNIKKCWQSNQIGANISFIFYGNHLQVTLYQNSKGLGTMNVYLDDETIPRKIISSYFEGYPWAKGNGRQHIISLFDNDDISSDNNQQHMVTFTIRDEPANIHEPGHECQIIALMYAQN